MPYRTEGRKPYLVQCKGLGSVADMRSALLRSTIKYRRPWVYGFRLKIKYLRRVAERRRLNWRKDASGIMTLLTSEIAFSTRVFFVLNTGSYQKKPAMFITFVKGDERRRLRRNRFSEKDMDKRARSQGGTRLELSGNEYDPNEELESEDEDYPEIPEEQIFGGLKAHPQYSGNLEHVEGAVETGLQLALEPPGLVSSPPIFNPCLGLVPSVFLLGVTFLPSFDQDVAELLADTFPRQRTTIKAMQSSHVKRDDDIYKRPLALLSTAELRAFQKDLGLCYWMKNKYMRRLAGKRKLNWKNKAGSTSFRTFTLLHIVDNLLGSLDSLQTTKDVGWTATFSDRAIDKEPVDTSVLATNSSCGLRTKLPGKKKEHAYQHGFLHPKIEIRDLEDSE
ncbi:uncharacterized protein FOMMEDRAFT_160213 [Fomitiporia mediterranea MF3/22]|uniref:uncharacterized protein n=1 Tax=Fomitiporia mediterranea (strain MF3/22) TaxID=694068 RepID=UPI00044093EE|nr:uncharacterized protein FOMMEDRAFT_160213 [Fomitiporia mediterranea MF3/22]EJC99772.1 hypothetical protein FOMMEDRAFT_160213 [Fomitiporia mediterranea MF3/22]